VSIRPAHAAARTAVRRLEAAARNAHHPRRLLDPVRVQQTRSTLYGMMIIAH
jgi:hypothetical protein